MDSNISTYTGNYQIRAYEIDMHKRCTPPALIQIMHEASLMHTIKLGVSVWDLEKQKISWVLRSMHIEINRLPLLNESIKLLTYPSGYQRMFTYRDYYVYDQDDILIASSKTKWVLMDTEQRKFTPFPEAMKALIQLEGKQTLPIPNDKIKKIDIKDYSHRFVVNWYDLDFNQHLNNIVYIKWALQSLSNEVL
ncbi:MAG: acyl-ACP thioesterase domain-containing protein, partial [Bacteroidota bacterium]